MNLQPVEMRAGQVLFCFRCGLPTIQPVADLDGPAFKAYYCPQCVAPVELAARMEQARKLPSTDLAQHAAVSLQNNETCGKCFCCCALAVLRERGEFRPEDFAR